ncbi:alpha-ketoglutarate permease [Alkalihalobacillus alcalophilus ATCC 27647 = CGMCC 1.3604]|uniref:Alpha-ketoglutarate permease n=2 Tax=Alkalihalobacillus alcalophilus ATCC 27647 = CGMCC 1.3604 TaxID=1218173 RepID=A0A094WKW2_ALKAL|nr:MFS transporter [Alkalihalobacillus alcalophilus]KGA98384.1 alpha-ketoglutarate permease [Alkalihalobacillus alcalophilus ATCC 27647 = CGMCC 1.3604]MED1563917.1 MFS transporter [Alkalihalobacillus alcalophilus]THG91593.1 alpha-ketoglutarate permease [Alkalihalobacillus alcalophilus ATCC 27647 = CGMCC 1.3604]
MNSGGLLGKAGMDGKMALGYLGVMIFMVGEGLEMGWLSAYLIESGLTVQQSALLFSIYGFAVAIAAWLSGVLAEILGVRKAMLIGVAMFATGTVIFLTAGIPSMNLGVMIPTYSLRGLGYPLFAYSFLVWITYYAPQEKLGTAVGWFWVSFAGGLNVLGAYYSSFALPYLGEVNTLWSALIFTLLGTTIAILLNNNKSSSQSKQFNTKADALKYVAKGVTIAFENPKIGLGGIVRTINTAAAYGLVVFLPTYMMDLGFTRTEWLQIYGALWTSNVIFNLIFGIVGDKLGWRNTIMWFGGVGCSITFLALFYVPTFVGANYWATTFAAILFGACLAAYVPLSALIPSLSPENKGAAMSILNLGAGLSTFIGPVIVGLLIGTVGTAGIVWIFAGLHLFSAFLMKYVTLPKSENKEIAERLKAAQ